jgi:nitrite reductase/ring-hydroxylating ferredoxin subunit
MLTREDNELLTRTAPGTPMGRLLRRYWVPVTFSSALPAADCDPLRVQLLHEKLVAFRDSDGDVGLLGQHCPHRGASLFFGRNEECGLRCVYHGWKFDVAGRCVDMPNEPPESNFKDKVHALAYPCEERAGLIWAYMGPAHLKPALPELEWMVVPESHRYVSKRLQECNWLQAMEGGFDVSHLQFLHRGDLRAPGYAQLAHDVVRPKEQQVAHTDNGFVVGLRDELPDGQASWHAHQFLMPWFKGFSLNPRTGIVAGHMWVPVDDESCLLWSFEYCQERPLDDPALGWSPATLHTDTIAGSDRTAASRDNDYMIDRQRQRSGQSYTGIDGVGQQDSAIQESMGAIADRTVEHLGTADVPIIALRRVLQRSLGALAASGDPPGLDPASQRRRSVAVELPDGASFSETGVAAMQQRAAVAA